MQALRDLADACAKSVVALYAQATAQRAYAAACRDDALHETNQDIARLRCLALHVAIRHAEVLEGEAAVKSAEKRRFEREARTIARREACEATLEHDAVAAEQPGR